MYIFLQNRYEKTIRIIIDELGKLHKIENKKKKIDFYIFFKNVKIKEP